MSDLSVATHFGGRPFSSLPDGTPWFHSGSHPNCLAVQFGAVIMCILDGLTPSEFFLQFRSGIWPVTIET